MNFRTRLRLLLILSLSVVLMACGGGEETTTDGVASAADLDGSVEDATNLATDVAADPADDAGQTAEEAGLALAACMRESGIDDFPDPQLDENGNLNLRAPSGVDAQAEGFRDQLNVCRDEVGAENFGAGARGNQREGIQEQLLGYTQCLRDEGLDVGDVGAPGEGGQQGQNAEGDGDGNGQGRAQGAGGTTGSRSARIAQALGLDTEDPATVEALAACDEVLVQAFAGVGGGQPPATDNS